MSGAERGWWRENRLWFAALPGALLLTGLVSAGGVKDYWYDAGLHHRLAHAEEPGQWVSATDDYDDPVGSTSRTFRVRLADLEPTAEYPYYDEGPREPPDGVEALAARLDWEADPDQVLAYCRAALVDEEGRRYEVLTSDSAELCTPEGRPGPTGPFGADDDRRAVVPGQERPPEWSTRPVFLVPEGRRISSVLLWWETPQYVELDVELSAS